MTMKLLLPKGAIIHANVYRPREMTGATPMYGLSIDTNDLLDDDRFDRYFQMAPSLRDRPHLPATCRRPPLVDTNDVDKLVDGFLVAQAQNKSPDCMILENACEVTFDFFELGTVGRKGLAMSLLSVFVFF